MMQSGRVHSSLQELLHCIYRENINQFTIHLVSDSLIVCVLHYRDDVGFKFDVGRQKYYHSLEFVILLRAVFSNFCPRNLA